MKNAETDTRNAIAADEFIWAADGLTSAHSYILPALKKSLVASGAQSVIDFGCGNGALTAELSSAGYNIMGVDSSESGIRIAQQSYGSIEFIRGGVDDPLPPAFVQKHDAMIAVEVIEHLLLPRALFARAKEALRKQGTLIITTPYHGYLKNLAIALSNRFDTHWHPLRDFGHVKFFSERTLCQLFTEQGFKVEEVARVGRIRALAKSMLVRGRLR